MIQAQLWNIAPRCTRHRHHRFQTAPRSWQLSAVQASHCPCQNLCTSLKNLLKVSNEFVKQHRYPYKQGQEQFMQNIILRLKTLKVSKDDREQVAAALASVAGRPALRTVPVPASAIVCALCDATKLSSRFFAAHEATTPSCSQLAMNSVPGADGRSHLHSTGRQTVLQRYARLAEPREQLQKSLPPLSS